MTSMTAQFNTAFDRLLSAWRRREELRATEADPRALLEARRSLDQARIEMARTRGI